MAHACLLAIAALCLGVLPVAAQDKRRGDTSQPVPTIGDRFVFGAGTHTLDAPIVIPQTNAAKSNHGTWPYANPEDKVAGAFGLGATTSVVRVPLKVAREGAFITTENYGKRPVYTAIVRGLTIVGPKEWDMGQFPCNDSTLAELPDVATAIRLDAIEAIVEDCQIRLVRGPAISFAASAGSGYWLNEYRASNNRVQHCFTGIRARTDGRYNDNIIANVRDYCLEVPQDAGSVQSTANHYYGARKAIYVHNAESFHSTNDVFSDAEYGIHLDGYSNNAIVTGGYTQHCTRGNILCETSYCSFVNSSVKVTVNCDQHPDIVGVEFGGFGNQFFGGHVVVSSWAADGGTNDKVQRGGTAFRLAGDSHVVRTMIGSITWGMEAANDARDVCLDVPGELTGCQLEFDIPRGFIHPNARLLTVKEGAKLVANNITFRGRQLGAAVRDPEAFVDIAGRLPESNKITIIDTESGRSVVLKAGKTY